MRADDRISRDASEMMRGGIAEANGSEVVFVCRLNDDGLISQVEVVARGTESMAPAPLGVLRKGRVVVHNHPSGLLQPSEADVLNASELSDSGVGSFIVNNDVTDLTVVCEPAEPIELRPLHADDLVAVLDNGGPLSTFSDEFEPRLSQMDMLRAVCGSFNDAGLLAVEAGTGVGKSFAYLIPTLVWASQNDERVVISTATINLQQQLIDRDIPAVIRMMGLDVRAVLVKGRGNYVCRKRLQEAIDEATLFEEPDEEIERIREWANTTTTGSRSDAPFHPTDESWSRVNSDADTCTDLSCRLRDDCFFVKARREAASARVLVANHHLLFIDLSLRVRGIGFEARAVLPPFQRLIFDEAHNIENSATSLFSESFSVFTVQKHSRRLFRQRRSRQSGLLPQVRRRGSDPGVVTRAEAAAAEMETVAKQLDEKVRAMTDDPALRLSPALDQSHRVVILEYIRALHGRVVQLSSLLTDLVEKDDSGDEGGPFYDLRVTARRIDRLATLCRSFLEFEETPERVFWLEFRRSASGNRYARFISTPLDIRDIMREAVYESFDTVIFTSATLTIAGTFEFWASRIGLLESSRDADLLQLPSPFNYSQNALLAVPHDAPEPSKPEYTKYLSEFLKEALLLTEGHALVLFTSYEMLSGTFDAVGKHLTDRGILVMRQGQDDRARLLARFNDEPSSVLFATESFWQGVDAPGDALKLVVVCRLPFRVPTDPVLTARTEMIEARGGNAFRDLALPEAVMKLKQGFGRLIRRATDRGVVLITDVRVLTKPYGELFLRSLPETGMSTKSSRGVLEDIERFFYS